MKRQRFDNVWDALEDSPAEAVNMTMRSRLLIRLGISQPRLNDLLRGKIANFSLDTLINLAAGAGLSVRLDIAEAA